MATTFTYNTSYISSSSLWRYEYTGPTELNGKDLSNATINLSECLGVVNEHYSNFGYTIDVGQKGVKWDDLNHQGTGHAYFVIYSENGPVNGILSVKAGPQTSHFEVEVPSCEPTPPPIPELDTGLMLISGILFLCLFRRKF